VPNPYRPGFNQAPVALAGRHRITAAIDEVLAIAALDARTPRPLVLTGPRGVGKTVILGEAASRAADTYAWLTAPVEVRPGRPFLPLLADRLLAIRDLYRQAKPGTRLRVTGATVRASVLGVGGEIALTRDDADRSGRPSLEAALAEACAAAYASEAGVVVTIDELQLASKPELGELAATLQEHVPDDWPLVVLLAGLPSLRGSHRGVTYLERAEWHSIGLLDQADTLDALRVPAAMAERPMDDAAAARLAAASGGYPYAIQLMGHHAWRASSGAQEITTEHASAAIPAAQEELAAGLYAARWEDSSPREREYLRALAQLLSLQPRVTGAQVAAALGKPAKAVSWIRESLIQKGTIFPEGDSVRFTIPGLGDWLRSGNDPS